MPAKPKFLKILLIIAVVIFVVTMGVLFILNETAEEVDKAVNVNWDTYRNEKYGFEFEHPNYFDDIDIIDFDSLPKTIKESKEKLRLECEKPGEDCSSWGWARDASQEDLIKWKEWIEKGVLNHPDRYRNDTLFDIAADNLVEEKIVDIKGKKALKILSRSPQSPSATIELLIFSNKGDLIILSSNILTLNKDGNELSDEEYKNSPENIGFEKVISTLKFSK